MADAAKLPIIGREYALIHTLARLLNKTAGGFHDVTPIVQRHRGASFQVRICEGGHKRISTGRIAKVTIELDHVEQPDG